MNLLEIGKLVRTRREVLGLSQQRLARLAGLSRTTINLLESGSLADLGMAKVTELLSLLGLVFDAYQPGATNVNAIRMASKIVSVSYKDSLTPNELMLALATGEIPSNRVAHLSTLVDEVPLSLIVAAVETASWKTDVPTKQIWKHVTQWSRALQSPRKCWADS
jgi:transcriptional regulator with XRE-family HTH domain